MFSLLWSEHCSYKHSRKLLGTLPTEGEHVVMGPGENAGAVDVGDGLAVAFKVESHNHPSAVEPFQGAATGVGGILRDIFAIGARPIAVLDSLRFGEPSSPRSRYLLDHAVAGIAHYGNSVGVATVGGEVYHEGPYEQNCLVNAMALGLADQDRMIRSAAAGVGNVVVLFGSSTGQGRHRRRLGPGERGARHRRGQAPDRAGRRPVRRQEGARVLARAARARAARLAAGPRRRGADVVVGGDGVEGRGRPRPRRLQGAAARGGHGAVRDHGQRVPGADALRLRARPPRRGARGLREVGGPRDRDRRGDRRRPAARARRRPGGGRRPGRRARGRVPALRPRSGRAGRPGVRPAGGDARRGRRRRARRSWRCSRARTSPRACRSSSSTTGSCSRAPCAARARPTPRSCGSPGATRSPWPSTAPAGGSPRTRTRARSRTCSSARRTSRASAPSRSG